MSKKYHPDINPDEAAHEKFIEVSKAYEILSDDEVSLTSAVAGRYMKLMVIEAENIR